MRRASRVLVAIGLCLSGCTQTAIATAFQLDEFSITGPGGLDSRIDSIEVANSGDLPHTLVVTNSEGEVVAATDLIQPGQVSTLDVSLEDGRYTFTCRIVAENDRGEIIDHFEAGMVKSIGVAG